ncbi:MAG: septal ring lytic transglycosylase RlpA family protein [Flavisolibacter sp.]|nr:septal ring lytic transglycosylase RlpA family protein [Flavisolibacter sp.]
MKNFCYLFIFLFLSTLKLAAQPENTDTLVVVKAKSKSHFGIASYYADKFEGRKTASGEIYYGNKLSAACNILPLGTLIRVTNLRNKKRVIVKVNDRLHPQNKRIVDMSKSAAEMLGYTRRGLTEVKVEVLTKASMKVE